VRRRKKRQLEPYEVDLLKEKKFLLAIVPYWRAFVNVTESALQDGTDYLDPHLAFCIGELHERVKGLLYFGAELQAEDQTVQVPSILHMLEDVRAEIKVTQAGKPPKRGGPAREEMDIPPPPRGMPEGPEDGGE
jgi:hypothetical protein